MENKEIYIDGVNVAGCDFVSKIGGCDSYTDGVCEGHNCEHKQLKRLEQENKELKEQRDKYYQQTLDDEITISDLIEEIQTLKSDRTLERISKLSIENARLEQENKKLKKDAQLFKCLDTFGENECHCACRCLGNEFCEDADKKINTYRSALEEIREKAQHCIKQDVCTLCDYSKECAVPDTDGVVYDNNRLLIKLINEVLNESK